MTSRSRVPPALIIASAVLFLLLPPAERAQAQEESCAGATTLALYLDSSNALSSVPPSSEGSAPIPARAGGPLVWLVGTWNSPAIGRSFSYSGTVNFSLWARATGPVQLSCRFQVYVGVNDQRPDNALNTNTARLTSTPQEFTGTGEVQLSLSPGDTIGFWVYAHERGGGGELLFGGSYPSRLVLQLAPLTVNMSVVSRAGELEVSGNISDFWGPDDVQSVELAVMGPFSSAGGCGLGLLENRTRLVKHVEELPTDELEGELTFSYIWRYDQAAILSGHYAVAIVVHTRSNLTAGADGWVRLTQTAPAEFGGSAAALAAVAAVMFAAGMVYYVYRKRKGAGGPGLRFLASRTGAVVAAGAVVLLVVAIAGVYLTMAPASGGSELAPDFTLTDTKGNAFTLSGLRGKVVVLDLMATWCPTCNQEIYELTRLHKERPGAVIISIDIDRTESAQLLESHMRSKGVDWVLAMDTDNVMSKYHVTEIPKLVVVSPGGHITFMKAALVRSDELIRAVDAAYGGSAPVLSIGKEQGFAVLAFVAGCTAFFSPCAFPLLPGYISYYLGRREDMSVGDGRGAPGEGGWEGTGVGVVGGVVTTTDRADVGERMAEGGDKGASKSTGKRRVLRSAVTGGLAAAIGVLAVYAFIGAIVGSAGAAVKSHVALLTPLVAVVVIVMGVVMLTDYTIPVHKLTSVFRPLAEAGRRVLGRVVGREATGGSLGLMAYGAGYGAASLACHAPIFISVVLMGLAAGGFASAFLAFILFGIGMGSFMVLVTILLGLAKERLVRRMRGWIPAIKKASGVALVVIGCVVIYSYYLSKV
ncbi:MAG: cytochrome c biogenesis protein CcdA [Thermoplasmata archaeon]